MCEPYYKTYFPYTIDALSCKLLEDIFIYRKIFLEFPNKRAAALKCVAALIKLYRQLFNFRAYYFLFLVTRPKPISPIPTSAKTSPAVPPVLGRSVEP